MASSTRRYLNTVSIGDYEWIDEMKKDGRRRRICSSILEIIEQGDVVHVLDFELRLLGVKQGDEEIKEACVGACVCITHARTQHHDEIHAWSKDCSKVIKLIISH